MDSYNDEDRDVHRETIKCVVVGDTGVGKTRLICAKTCGQRLTNLEQLVTVHIPTVWAIDQYRISRRILEKSYEQVDNVNISLRLWDTFGDHNTDRRFAYGKSDVVLLCFSIANPRSLRHVKTIWYPEIKRMCPHAPIILVGCQNDLRYLVHDPKFQKLIAHRRPFVKPITASDIIYPEQGRNTAKEIGAVYYETSVFSFFGIEEVYQNVIRAALCRRRETRFWLSALDGVQRPLLQAPAIPPKPLAPKCLIYPSLFAKEFSSIFRDSTDFDVILRQEKFSAPAHRLFLSAASPLFYRIFVCETVDCRKCRPKSPPFDVSKDFPTFIKSPTADILFFLEPGAGDHGHSTSDFSGGSFGASKHPPDLPNGTSKHPPEHSGGSLKHPLEHSGGSLKHPPEHSGGSLKHPLEHSGANFPAFCNTIAANANSCYAKLKKSKKSAKCIKGSHSAYGCLENSDSEKSLHVQNPIHARLTAPDSIHWPKFVKNFRWEENSWKSGSGSGCGRWVIEICEKIPWECVRLILHFIYTGEFMINAETKLDLLQEIADEFELNILSQLITNADLDLADYQEKFHKRLFELSVDSGLFNDIHFILDNGRLSGQKALITARSEVLKATFGSHFRESLTAEVAFPGLNVELFWILLFYFHTDCLPSIRICYVDYLDLLELANRLCLPHLVTLLEYSLISELSHSEDKGQLDEDVLLILEPAQLYNANQLVDWCLSYCSANYNRICKLHPKLIKTISPANVDYLAKNRWPPVWYLKEYDVYERTLRERIKMEPKLLGAGLKRHRSRSGCLCFAKRSKQRRDHSVQ